MPTDDALPMPRARRWREVSRRIRAAVWHLQGPAELHELLEEIHRGILALDMPLFGCGVNIVDPVATPPTVTVNSLSDGTRFKMREMAAGAVLTFWRAGEPVVRDLDGDDPHDEKRIFPYLRTMVDVPFSHGTLAVNSQQRHAFTEADVARLQDIADLLGDGFRRLDELRRLQVRMRVREQVWRMRTPEDIVPVMATLREGLTELGVSFTHCGLNLLRDSDGGTLVHTMERGTDWVPITQAEPDRLILSFWRQGTTAYRRDLQAEDPYRERETLEGYYRAPIRSVIDVPFSHGTLALNHSEPGAFSDDQVALMEDLAHLLEDGFRRVDDLRILQARNEALEREVAERRRAEAELEASVAEKVVLLKEIHHRVKNNLQVVSSLLSLRSQTLDDPAALRSFEDSRAQIQSMALIHERLYDSQDLAHLDCGDYVRALAENVFSSYGVDSAAITLEVDAEPHTVSVDTAIQCGLVVHELVSNALRHAFPEDRGTVRVAARPTEQGRGSLCVSDDGIGLATDLDVTQTRSLGLRLVGDLARQLNSTLEVGRQGGASFSLTYPLEG